MSDAAQHKAIAVALTALTILSIGLLRPALTCALLATSVLCVVYGTLSGLDGGANG